MLIRLLEVDVYDEDEINTGQFPPGDRAGRALSSKPGLLCLLGFACHLPTQVMVGLKVMCPGSGCQ